MDLLATYQARYPDIPGWFTHDSMVVWDFLLTAQKELSIKGDFLEIGVWKGRSAVLGALYLHPDEWCVLVDKNPIQEAAALVNSVRPDKNKYLRTPSSKVRGDLGGHMRKCRWVHIDGDHTGSGVTNDLVLAADLIHEDGIICVDDFFSFRYPQITAATYAFLLARRGALKLFFAGINKGYICRLSMFDRYDAVVRGGLMGAITRHGLNVQMNRTTTSADDGCFTISWREGDRRLVGLDDDMDKIPA